MPLRRLPALGSLRAFEAAARHLSFKEAAAELAVTPAAVSQQIRALEEDLEIKLFSRTARAVSLTEAGQRLQPALTEAFLNIRNAVDRIRPSSATPLRVESSSPVLTKWLLPRLHRFSQRYPEIDISITSVSPLSDLAVGRSDIYIRFTRNPDADYYAHKLCDEYSLPLASPDLVARLGIENPKDLLRAPLLHDMSHELFKTDCHWPSWFARVGLDANDADRGTRFDRYGADHAIDAAVSGAGVVLGRRFLARRDMLDGRLVSPFGPTLEFGASYYVVCKFGSESRPDIAAFINWISTEAEVGHRTSTLESDMV